MVTILAILVVLFAVVTALADQRYFRVLLLLSSCAFLVGGLGFGWPFLAPKDFFIRHPQLADTPLHPYVSALYGGIALIFGGGILLGLLWRFAVRCFTRNRSKSNVT